MNNEQIENRSFTLTECMFAWLCYFAGYAFCRCFPVMKYPLGGFLFIVALFTVTIIIFGVQKRKFKIWPFIVALSSVAIAFSLLLSTNRFLFFWAFLYSITAYCYFVYAYLGNNIKGGFSDFIILDFLKATIILPFASFGKLLIAMFTGKAKSSAKSIVKIFIGIFITIIPMILNFGIYSSV